MKRRDSKCKTVYRTYVSDDPKYRYGWSKGGGKIVNPVHEVMEISRNLSWVKPVQPEKP